jgi:hypothetical protein
MEKHSSVPRYLKGPEAYENWKAELGGIPSKGASEYPLFTDAHITGEIVGGYGPYQLLNTVPIPGREVVVPAIILRFEEYIESVPVPEKRGGTQVHRYHGGRLVDEIAALVSLCLGIRLKAGGYTRLFDIGGNPRGRPVAWGAQWNPVLLKRDYHRPILPRAVGTHPLEGVARLAGFPSLLPHDAVVLVRCARLYQDAIWIAESAPELSWIMLASAVESAAGRWREETESSVERLRASKPDLEKLLKPAGGKKLVLQVADQLADSLGATRKFSDFILKFMPEPPEQRPPKAFQHSWERKDIRKSLRKIYNWRSLALHGGIPFPLPMCQAPFEVEGCFSEIPPGLATMAAGAVWGAEDTPMLLNTFEYIVRHALLKWWESMLHSRANES